MVIFQSQKYGINSLIFGNKLDYGPIQFYPSPECNKLSLSDKEYALLQRYKDRINDAVNSRIISKTQDTLH